MIGEWHANNNIINTGKLRDARHENMRILRETLYIISDPSITMDESIIWIH